MATNGEKEEEIQEKPTTDSQAEPVREPLPVEITDIELEQLQKDASEFKDKYLRSIAESENLRKRLHKERHEMVQMSTQNIITEFLNPIDHMENALSYTEGMSDEVKNWAIGFKMILNQFKDVLTSNDIHPFQSVGKAFDPHIHEAIEMIETTDAAPGTVIEESLKGYKMGNKTIRPARVKVSKAPKIEESE